MSFLECLRNFPFLFQNLFFFVLVFFLQFFLVFCKKKKKLSRSILHTRQPPPVSSPLTLAAPYPTLTPNHGLTLDQAKVGSPQQ